MVAPRREGYTLDEYFALERESEVRLEYRDGEIVAMVGGSEAHSLIQLSIGSMLRSTLRDRNCFVYPSDMKVQIAAANIATYPDVSVVCGEREFTPGRRDAITNPVVIIEVLSPNTEGYDRGKKFAHYRRIPSLREYLLVAQDAPTIDHFQWQEGGILWTLSSVNGLDQSLTLPTLGCTLPLAEIYRQVDFASAPDDEA